MSNIDITKLRTIEVKRNERIADKKKRRDALLAQFDTELYRNQLYWEELTPSQRAARTEYRKALLDLTKQPGFPDSVVWPPSPK